MTAMTLQVLIATLACLFAGIVLFLASVLKQTFDAITEAEYYAVFTQIIKYGRASILINTIVLLPLILLIVYLFLFGLEDLLFIAGVVIYIIGSFVLSRAINEPMYTQLLAQPQEAYDEIARLRTRLNYGNTIRAVVSTAGVLCMGISLIF